MENSAMNWKRIIGHAFILFIATFAGGFVIGLTGENVNDPQAQILIGISNIIFVFLGTLLISVIHRPTWKHLLYVWLVMFAISIPNFLIVDTTLVSMFAGAFILAIPMALANLAGSGILKMISVISRKNTSD